jgi:glycosyltransferase involved in cell wall biosynthesis
VKILHLITTLDVGGAEKHLLAQVAGQVTRGHAVRVLDAGAEQVERIGTGLGAPTRIVAGLYWADVAHTHLLKADMLGALLALLFRRARILVSSKHNDERVLENALVARVHGVLGNVPLRTIVLSDHVGRYFRDKGRVRPERITRIYYGIDPTPFERAAGDLEARRDTRARLGIGEDEVVFTCVARFAPQKAHDVLLRAFTHALADAGGERMRLLLVGDDPFGDGRRKAKALAAGLGLAERALFAGIRRDVPAVLAASDVFVLSSLWEGFGLVFLEAMASGLPVLASAVSAVPEVVVDGETGLLVPPGDAAALSQGMLALARDAGLRQRLGRAGRARVRERFGLERMVDETLAAYAQVVAT